MPQFAWDGLRVLLLSQCNYCDFIHPQSALVLMLHYIDVLTFNHLILLSLRACVLSHFSHVQLFATLWTVAH